MKTEQYHSKGLIKLFRKQKVATLKELKIALGTQIDVTVFRKLKPLGYTTSYSHRGAYYTLASVAHFDAQGLWGVGDIRFSKSGTLVRTVEALVTKSEAGYFSRKLDQMLAVTTKETLLRLFKDARITREKISGRYLYCATNSVKRNKQLHARRILQAKLMPIGGADAPQVSQDEFKAALVLFFTLLDEKQRRLYAGLESVKLGYGGDRKIADIFGIDVHTVAKGRRQLFEADVEPERVRKTGAGRKTVEKKRRRSSNKSRN